MCTWFSHLWFTQLPTNPKPFHYPHSQTRKLRSREVDQRVLGHTAGVVAQGVGCLQHNLPPTPIMCSESQHVDAESKTQSWMCMGGHTLGGEGTGCIKGGSRWRGRHCMHKVGAHVGRGRRCLPTGPRNGKKQIPLLSQSRSATPSPWSPHSTPEHQ